MTTATSAPRSAPPGPLARWPERCRCRSRAAALPTAPPPHRPSPSSTPSIAQLTSSTWAAASLGSVTFRQSAIDFGTEIEAQAAGHAVSAHPMTMHEVADCTTEGPGCDAAGHEVSDPQLSSNGRGSEATLGTSMTARTNSDTGRVPQENTSPAMTPPTTARTRNPSATRSATRSRPPTAPPVDLVMTVALGSTLATILLSSDVSWTEGVAALALLAGLQFCVAWTSSRWAWVRRVFTSRPTVLLRDGHPCQQALTEQRVTLADLRQAIRSSGQGSLDDVAVVVLESDGSFSVVPRSAAGDLCALGALVGDRSAGAR